MNRSLIVSWNVRGLGRVEKKVVVRRCITTYKAAIVFLQETKLQLVDDRVVKRVFGNSRLSEYSFSPSSGAVGGLITVWDLNMFECLSSSTHPNHILLRGELRFQGKKLQCVLMNIYAPNDGADRKELLRDIKVVLMTYNCPVFLGGDFNVVRNVKERIGNSSSKAEMTGFSKFIDSLALVDLPLAGGRFTWSSIRDVPAQSRLDRFLLSPKCLECWPDLTQQCLPKNISDHNPIALMYHCFFGGPKPFRYFDYWTDYKDYNELIKMLASRSNLQRLARC
ncbi:hypothetical protein HRI_000088500 [Hibiscus trionum]|uniref:Endonuclease/exonuclease/phosphatase domain-containing protein n=1 Tax=Hibiscus trionum TaxID=183268 RepID=A0A9W7GR75_HIBTR|nr:hypothetical protein HRI_000088500 [Hibiscus trionum]